MYIISRLTHDLLEKHSKIFGMFQPSFLMLCGSSPHSYDSFRRLIFFGEKNAAAFLVVEKGSKKISAVIVFHQFDKENDLVFMHLIPVGDKGFDSDQIAQAIRTLLKDTFKKFNLYSIRSNVLGTESRTKKAFEMLGFKQEAELKEQIYIGNKLEPVLIYTLFAKDLENA